MPGKILLSVTLIPLGLALACGIFGERQAAPVEADPEPRPPVAEQVPDVLRCDAELRRFLADVSHPVVTADGANVGVSYVQSHHDDHCPPSRWNPHVSEVAIDDAGNIDVSFALPSVATGRNPVTTTGEGTLRWMFLIADGRWYAAEPHHPMADRSENWRPTAEVVATVATPAPVPTWPHKAAPLPTWAPLPTAAPWLVPTLWPPPMVSRPTPADSIQPTAPAPTPTPEHAVASNPPRRSTQPPAPSGSQGNLQRLMLDLTNERRAAAGVPAVRMGNNRAAQLHAQAALEGCYSGHWDRWGLKPNHRYTLAGGTGADGENTAGGDYCIKASDNYAPRSMEQEVRETVQGWMDSPGHRENLLHPAHTVLNIGIAHDRYNTVMAQHFSTDYVRYSQRPTISNDGTLTFSATVLRATLDIGNTVKVQITYDRPPKPLTVGQLTYTYALCNPAPVGYVVEPPPKGSRYADDETHQQAVRRKCVDPYLTPPNRAAPANAGEAHQAWAAAKSASDNAPDVTITTSRVIAEAMTVSGNSITVIADLGRILDHHGPGIYTVILWGRPNHMSAPTPLSEQAIFWKTRPPSGAPY